MPSINALSREYQGQGLTTLLVDIREDPELVARTARGRGYAAPVVLDRGGEVADAYGVTGTPTVFVIGRTGLVLGRAIGPRPWTEASGRALLQALLAAPRPAVR